MPSTVSLLSNTTAKTNSSTNSSATGIANNFETFLNLLTTQLKNQSPLDPLDTNQFTQQLVQFASVEQQLKTNDSLASLLAAAKVSQTVGALSLVNAQITADGATSQLTNQTAQWRINAPRAVSNAQITITNSAGQVVFTEKRNFVAGDQPYTWNGKMDSGLIAQDGEYKVNINATDPAGKSVKISTELQGTVDKIDISGSEPIAWIGNVSIPLSNIKTIQRP